MKFQRFGELKLSFQEPYLKESEWIIVSLVADGALQNMVML